MENIPKVETKETEMSKEEKRTELIKLSAEFSQEEIKDALKIKADEVKAEPVVEIPKAELFAKELSPEIKMVAETLMATSKEKVKGIYKDADYSGIEGADLNLLQKTTLMESVMVPNARLMANIEKNLKSNDANDTTTETKSAEFSKPESKDKVDKKAGETLYTNMSEKLGLIDEKGESE